jgi:hypothetical protein
VGRPSFALVVVVFALLLSAATASARSDGSSPAPAKIMQLVTNVPATTLNQVGAGHLLSAAAGMSVAKLHRRLESHGKPELLTENLAWCPHCAANSWGLAIALSRFGTLSGLREISSGTYYCVLVNDPCNVGSPAPCFPNTDGLSFIDARYHSRYLTFVPLVVQTVTGKNLEGATRSEITALNQFDSEGQTPAVDIGGTFGFVNSAFSPGDLAHKSWSQISASLADPGNATARRVDGLANVFAAAICKVTKGRPASVCKSHGVIAAGDERLR